MVETSQQDERKDENSSNIKLSVPWGGGYQHIKGAGNIFQGSNIAHTEESSDMYKHFVTERTRLHEIYIREEAKSKRLGLSLAFVLILSASLILLFAPDGRETQSYWIGTALIIFAAGAAGFGRVWGKAASISFGADQDQRGLDQ